jgi:hypothetical protein
VLSVGLCGLLKQFQKPDSCGFEHQAPFWGLDERFGTSWVLYSGMFCFFQDQSKVMQVRFSLNLARVHPSSGNPPSKDVGNLDDLGVMSVNNNKPIKMVIWGMVYYCFNHIIPILGTSK